MRNVFYTLYIVNKLLIWILVFCWWLFLLRVCPLVTIIQHQNKPMTELLHCSLYLFIFIGIKCYAWMHNDQIAKFRLILFHFWKISNQRKMITVVDEPFGFIHVPPMRWHIILISGLTEETSLDHHIYFCYFTC